MEKRRIILQIIAVAVMVAGSVMPFFVTASPAIAKTENPYVVRTYIDDEGNEIAVIVVPGRPPETKARAVAVPEPNVQAGINALSDVPAFDWSYGCSATSAAMLFGFYDRTGYSNMYAGSTNGGVCPLDNSVWGVDAGECPLSATHMGYDGLAVRGHVDDYWYSYLSAIDPYYDTVPPWTEHGYADCTADYMGTNQYQNWNNVDGSTTFYYYPNGSPLYDYTGDEVNGYRDGCHGMRLFAESRGYSVVTNYTQLIYGYDGNTQGFTFADYMAEIDAGRPVLIHVMGHTMLGYGYDSDSNLVYLHDTWDYSNHTMTWGGYYNGDPDMVHWGVTVIQLAEQASPTEVWVDDDYTPGGGNDGHTWGYDAFTAIQDGIDAVAGSTVHVAAGTYYENITLSGGVQVLGAGADVTTIDGGGSGSVVTADGVGSSTKLDGFTITNGYADYGGGMYNVGSAPTVSNCIFYDNSTYYHGGGMYNINCSPTVTDCTFSSNSAGFDGGGMQNINSWVTVTNCTFIDNSAGDDGGGMYIYNNCSPTVVNCTFIGNSAASKGGGMYNDNYVSAKVTNCTFSDNSAASGGNGIANYYSSPTVTNCILWDGGNEISNEGPSAPVVSYCDVQGGYSGTGNINAAPLFFAPGVDDYHLQLGSPCIDVGNNSAPSIPGTDFEGDARIMDGDSNGTATVDMGADEYLPIPPGTGLLRVQTDPAVPTTISIDGIPRNAWGLDYVKMASGRYTLSFTDTPGYLAPTEIEVTYYPGGGPTTQPLSQQIQILPDTTTEVIVHFVPLGNLWVRTDPMVSTIISLDGEPPANNWGFWVDLLAGDYALSVSDVVGYATPIEVEVTYPGESTIIQPITDPITVEAGGTTAVVVHFIQLGNLKVETSPGLPATIFVDGNPMNAWGFWLYLEAGDYTISFEDIDGYITPAPEVITITAGVTTYVTGYYVSE